MDFNVIHGYRVEWDRSQKGIAYGVYHLRYVLERNEMETLFYAASRSPRREAYFENRRRGQFTLHHKGGHNLFLETREDR
ncbi:MAG: hypothetical protein A3B23_01080 [Candidatus Colwellbacteria bacterium RIFCSPLOWO2_01_FULL_48_10]|uniref:Uncharacterized protein n=1 Tax=Candidatus Colwellbacteria bacterium RIFCSPLOWO2_01_FULL_48_10 TaxID=1797690 RepID=A0A1G1Z4I6_9BACT|nr:MAG: hypothetical protein A3B23_01080 [Candidatus Colwellbacteria bacterium RIFCSPLOWO2_01_FULL_48_10]